MSYWGEFVETEDRAPHWGYVFYERRTFKFRWLFSSDTRTEAVSWIKGWRFVVAYVGESMNPVNRIRGHKFDSEWFDYLLQKGFVWEVYPLFDGKPVTKAYVRGEWEVPKIVELLPLYNIKDNPRRPTDPLTIVKLRLGSTTRRKVNSLFRLLTLSTLIYTALDIYGKLQA